MILVAYFLCLLALLIGFVALQKIPRRAAFEVVHLTVWVFVISSFLSLMIVDRVAPNRLDGLVPFIPPVIPAAIFAAWMLRRAKIRYDKPDA
jgi:hypothetical protein